MRARRLGGRAPDTLHAPGRAGAGTGAIARLGHIYLADEAVESVNRVGIFGPKAERVPKVLQEGIRHVPLAQRRVEAGDGLRGNDANGPGTPRFVPEVEIREPIAVGRDNFLELITDEEDGSVSSII